MAISRPIVLAVVGALVALTAFYATMGARRAEDGSNEPARLADRDSAKQGAKKAESRSTPAGADKTAATGTASGNGTAAKQSQAAPGRAAAKPEPAARPGLPADVARALAADRTVVLFFYQRGAADDAATAKAVAAIRGHTRAKIFTASISRAADYRTLTTGVGLSQAPAIVILRKGRSAQLVEGFVDPETLAQQVADTR